MVSVWGRNDTKTYGNKQPSSVSFPNNHKLGIFLSNIPARPPTPAPKQSRGLMGDGSDFCCIFSSKLFCSARLLWMGMSAKRAPAQIRLRPRKSAAGRWLHCESCSTIMNFFWESQLFLGKMEEQRGILDRKYSFCPQAK